MALVAAGFTACDDSSDLGIMQVNPQEPIVSAAGVGVAFSEALSGEEISLADYKSAGLVPVLSEIAAEDFPADANVYAEMYISANEDMSSPQRLPVTEGAVDVFAWKKANTNIFGNSADPVTEWIGFAIYSELNGQVTRIGGPDFFYAKKQISVAPLPQYLYTPGSRNDWGFSENNSCLQTLDGNQYWGYLNLEGEFKFTNDDNWSNLILGAGSEDGHLASPGDNIVIENPGLYWVTVNIEEMTYSITKVENIGIIGSFGTINWDAQVNLTPSADKTEWTGDFTFEAGNEWKFRSNDNWDINLGGDLTYLVLNGSNIAITENGTYTVKLNIATVPYTCTLVKK